MPGVPISTREGMVVNPPLTATQETTPVIGLDSSVLLISQFGPFTFTPAQIQGMFAAPLSLIPAQGAGSLIVLVNIQLEINAAGVAYAAGGNGTLSLGTKAIPPNIPSTFFTTPTTPVICSLTPGNMLSASGVLTAPAAVLNQPLTLSNLAGSFTGGSGNVIVQGLYTVLKGF